VKHEDGEVTPCARVREDRILGTRNATLGGTVPLWEWIGDEPATTFSY
jgi:hypothetical protein